MYVALLLVFEAACQTAVVAGLCFVVVSLRGVVMSSVVVRMTFDSPAASEIVSVTTQSATTNTRPVSCNSTKNKILTTVTSKTCHL